uniref:hypothetical protein n=2 Tax=unclassified Streptomyces TaxID=2593676 RepID=UPI00215660DC
AAALAVLAALAVTATGCAGDTGSGDPDGAADTGETTPHGYVEGAEEAAEQQSRLVLADPETGAVRVLDLITGESHPLDDVPGTTSLRTDGRFAHLHTDAATHLLDSGAWTVDHGDHVHYYRAAVSELGAVPADGPGAVRADARLLAVTDTSVDGPRDALLFARDSLESPETEAIPDGTRLAGPFAGPVIPYAEHLIAPDGGDGPASVGVHTRDGERVDTLEPPCEDPHGDAVTRRGVVLGCADGALLVTEDDGVFHAEKIPYGDAVPAAERAREFRGRPGSATLTALAGDEAVWVLDVTGRGWTRVETGPVVAVNTAGEGAPLLALTADGVLEGYDLADGTRTTGVELLRVPPEGGGRPVIEVDTSRAYVNDPLGRTVHEIDYNDDLRIARTFELDLAPGHMVETGR